MPNYGQYCPVAKATELLGDRWTLLIIRELMYGPIRFTEMRHNLPGISKSVLSGRLKRLVSEGIAARTDVGDYVLTDAGEALRPALHELGSWVARWVMDEPTRAEADPELLMLFVSRHVDTARLPKRRVVSEWRFPDHDRRIWLTMEPEDVSVCLEDPLLPIDLYVTGDSVELYRIYSGRSTLDAAIDRGAVELSGTTQMRRGFRRWMLWSSFATAARSAG